MANPMYGQNKFDSKVSERYDNKFKYVFDELPTPASGAAANQLLAGADDELFTHTYTSGLKLYGNYVGANTVDIPPAHTGGVEYSMTDTDNIGCQFTVGPFPGAKGREGETVFTVGTAACYAKLKLKITDVSGTDDLQFGFRLASDAVETTYVGYYDFASLNVDGGDIKYETNLNGGSATSADSASNWVDNQVGTLEVRVSQAGVATFYHNGSQLTSSAPTFTFDTGDIITPVFYFRNAAHTTDVVLKEIEFGLQ